MRKRDRRPTYQLRLAVEALPKRTKEAMLRGIDSNRIIVGAYVDPRSGGVCPMLAAHRNGGRTSVASFARAWDAYTGAKRPRRATRREVSTLRSLLQWSLERDGGALPTGSIAELAAQIRAEREQLRCATAPEPPPPIVPGDVSPPEPAETIRIRRRRDTGEHHRGRELRLRAHWAWLRPARRLDDFKDLLAAAEEELNEQRLADLASEASAAAGDPAAHRR